MTEVEKLLHQIDARGYTHLIFDLDETLTQLNLPWMRWVEMVAERLPLETAKRFRAMLRDSDMPWGSIQNELAKESVEFTTAATEASQEFERTYFAHTPYRELADAVRDIAVSGKKVFIWTSNARETAERALVELGLQSHVTKIVAREDVRLLKPHPQGWEYIDDGTPKKNYLFVGDSRNDKRAAKTLGIGYFEITFFH